MHHIIRDQIIMAIAGIIIGVGIALAFAASPEPSLVHGPTPADRAALDRIMIDIICAPAELKTNCIDI